MEIIGLLAVLVFYILPFFVADTMAQNRGLTRLGTFLMVFIFSWLVPVVYLFVNPVDPK